MKKTALFITIGIITLIVGGYYSYQKFFIKQVINAWELVPGDALFVYEKNDCNECVKDLAKSAVTSLVKSISTYSRDVDSIQSQLSSLVSTSSSLLISAHATKKDELDFIFYTTNIVEAEKIVQSLSSYKYNVTSRGFNGVQINEIRFPTHKFSFVRFDEVWVGTYTPFLIEDVIRTYKKNAYSNRSDFVKQNFSSIKEDAGNLYVNLKHFNDWLSLFSSDGGLLFPFGVTSSLDIKNEENSVVLNGFSYDSINERTPYALSIFRHQSPVPFSLKDLISNRATAVTAYGISQGKSFGTDLSSFVKANNKSIGDSLSKLASKYGFQPQTLYASINDEVVVNFFEANKGRSVNKVLLIKTSNPDIWKKTFNELSERLSTDTVFREHYSGNEIRQVPIYKFSEKIFYPLVTGFVENYYTSLGNVVIIADNLESLKNFLDDVSSEDTWGKSVAHNRFMESTLLESNVSFYFNPSRAFNFVSQHLQGRWQEFAKRNQSLIQSMQMSSVQFSHLNNNYYTNILLTYRDYRPEKQSRAVTSNKVLVNFDHPLTRMFAVKSHVNRANEILVQDSTNDLSLISTDGKSLWKATLAEKIISDVTQIDFFNNGKLQYFFATGHALHVIDRLGSYVSGFPIQLPSIDLQFVSVIDYDNSKKYRFLVSDKKGKLWMYDKEGVNLKGWDPKDIGGILAFAPRHHRIKGKDYVLATRTDGKLFLMNRRGENLKGFPIGIDTDPVGDFSLEVGGSLSDTYFTLISRDGFKIRFSPDGKIQAKEPLLKTSIRSTFGLINEKALKSYLIVQQDNKQLIIMDESGKKILSTEAATSNSTDVKYYEFGSGDSFIVLSDRIQGLSYVYDIHGNLLTTPPIESVQMELRPGNSGQFILFFIHDNVLNIQPL